jgi:sulfonate transport system substrate-binding protein
VATDGDRHPDQKGTPVLPRTPARRRLILPLVFLALMIPVLTACGSDGNSKASADSESSGQSSPTTPALDPAHPITLTVGVPRNFGNLSTLWARDTKIPGVDLQFKYFPVFTDMLAAFNAGQLDFTEIGDVGAISSFANGGDTVAVASTQPNPHNAGLIVPKDSPVKKFSDLKGKKIIFLKSTNSYTAFLRQIKKAGLQETDFQIVQVAGPDANTAFTNGEVDAYYTIDSNMADIINKTGARIINDMDGLADNLYPYVSHRTTVADKAPAIRALVASIADTITWIHAHPAQQAALLSPKIGFSEDAIKTGYARGSTGLQVQDAAFVKHEQKVAVELRTAGIIPNEPNVKDLFIPTFNDAVKGSGTTSSTTG